MTKELSGEKLLGCPFFGCEEEIDHGFEYVCCRKHTRTMTIKQWNSRSPALEPLDEEELFKISRSCIYRSNLPKNAIEYIGFDQDMFIDKIISKFGRPPVSSEIIKAFEEYVKNYGPMHEVECSEDDTCSCKYKSINDGINKLHNLLERNQP